MEHTELRILINGEYLTVRHGDYKRDDDTRRWCQVCRKFQPVSEWERKLHYQPIPGVE